jgi:hypothetical protein
MASLVLSGDTSGSITVSAPAVAGSNTQTLVATTGTLAPIVSGTAITLTNQTAPDFTSIPNWVKRITLNISGMSTNSTGNPLIQLGDAGGYETTGYSVVTSFISGSTPGTNSFTSGFGISGNTAAYVYHGSIIFSLLNSSTNTWAACGSISTSDAVRLFTIAGSKSLSDTLTSIRLYVDGTQFFDAGTINILYE